MNQVTLMKCFFRRERKLFDQHQKVTRAMADKEQRDELDLLRQQVETHNM